MSAEELEDAAKNEDWDKIDGVLPEICNNDDYVKRAKSSWLFHKDDNVRDLAASILEKTSSPLFEGAKDDLMNMMRSDTNPYARFRAGFALYAHGDKSNEVLKTLEEAKEDEDVADISRKYLEKN